MINIILVGCNGYMGRVVTALADSNPQARVVAGIDVNAQQVSGYPVFSSPGDCSVAIEQQQISHLTLNSNSLNECVIIDFSAPAAVDGLLDFAIMYNTPLILCATGYDDKQLALIEKASLSIPVFRSANMSIGINLVIDLIKRARAVLGDDFDVEIVERHHRRKVDAPSGTALMLADAVAGAADNSSKYVFERESTRKPREKHEIGISAMRGGTIVGVHEVMFAGQDEVIELKHTAASRDVFAVGALKAAGFIKDKPPGMYNMSDILT